MNNKQKLNQTKKQKNEISPIIVLLSLLISQKFGGFGMCPRVVIEDYNKRIMAYLKGREYNIDDVDDMLRSNKKLNSYCKLAYLTDTKQGPRKSYILKPIIDVDESFEILLGSLPAYFVEATVTFEALSDIIGTMALKKSDEVWEYVYGYNENLNKDFVKTRIQK